MDKLYNKGFLNSSGNNVARKRWREVALHNITTKVKKGYTPKSEHLNNFKCWRLVETDKWLMPVPVSEYLDAARSSQERFMPFLLPYGGIRQFLSPCYESILENLPVQLNGKLKVRDVKKNIKIFLHGFLDPKKCHFGIRKHVLGCLGEPPEAKKANFDRTLGRALSGITGQEAPKEPDWWHSLLDDGVFTGVDCDVFKKCPSVKAKERNCRRCKAGCFSAVHKSIRTLLACYVKKFVTFFEELKTQPKGSVQMDVWIEDKSLKSGDRVRLQVVFSDLKMTNIWIKMALGGVFYEEDEAGGNAVFHVSMLTLFLSDAKPYCKRSGTFKTKYGPVTLFE
jgi:ribosomal protein S27AE